MKTYAQNVGKWIIFEPKINFVYLYSISLQLYLMKGIEKWAKMSALGLQRFLFLGKFGKIR